MFKMSLKRKRQEIDAFIKSFQNKRERTIVIVDYGNVEKWKNSLKWQVDIMKLAQLIKKLADGSVALRRFYYGEDFGPKESSAMLSEWSRSVFARALMNRFYIVKKRVKYIFDSKNQGNYKKKCDMDVEMTVDLIRLKDKYENIVLFSGDGDLMYAIDYIVSNFGKKCYVFAARNHIGREVVDEVRKNIVEKLLYVEDFEYRLKRDRYFYKYKF